VRTPGIAAVVFAAGILSWTATCDPLFHARHLAAGSHG